MGGTTSVPNVPPPVASHDAAAPGMVGARPEAKTASSVTPFAWRGSPWALTGACLVNAALTVVTVGIYGFWGRTEIRRRTWACVRLHGEPLVYHGTPQELLRGFFAVLALVLLPLFGIGIFMVVLYGQASAEFSLYQVGLFLAIYPILAAIAFYRARRYRLARTSWRGIRGSLVGSSTRYGMFSWISACALPLTLGWIMPWRAVSLQRRVVEAMRLGDQPLRFVGTAGPVYGRFAVLWFATIALYVALLLAIGVALGPRFNPQNPFWWQSLSASGIAQGLAIFVGSLIAWSMMSSFYYARLYNHFAASTFIGRGPAEGGAVRFELAVSGPRLIWLFLTNALITYLSLYVLKPVATARAMKYYTENLRIVGPFEPAVIGQNTSAIDRSGEGLAQAFDLDAF